MIPRPEYEVEIYEEEFSEQNLKLQRFKGLVDKATGTDAKLSLRMPLERSRTPRSIGYEVVPQDFANMEQLPMRKESPDPSNQTMSVFLNTDGNRGEGSSAALGYIHEANESMSQFSANGGDEGVEVVDLGRYSTLSPDDTEHEDEILASPSSEILLIRHDSKLEKKYKSSDRTDVAFHRPDIEKTLKVE